MRFSESILFYFVLVASISFPSGAFGQVGTGDAEASNLLDRVREKLLGHPAFEAEFTFTMAFPEEDPVVYAGTLTQKEEKYKIDLERLLILSDGETRWVYNRIDNLVQIYDAEMAEGENLASPQRLLEKYTTGEYVYALVGQNPQNEADIIEFKPVDRYSEFSKIRVSISQEADLQMIETFEKNGTRSKLEIHRQSGIQPPQSNIFTFDAGQYPGVRIEDLRLD